MGVAKSTLNDQDRQKLDGIVQAMINNNEPEENIRIVVDDFKQKYSVKKKEDFPLLYERQKTTSVPSKLPSTVPSESEKDWEQRKTVAISQEPVKIPGEIKVPGMVEGIPDPVGEKMYPIEEKFNKSLYNINTFGRDGRLPGESTAQKQSIRELGVKTSQEVLQEDFDKSSEEYISTMDSFERNLFPSGKAAGQYVQKMIQDYGVDAIKDNKTVHLAFDKYQRYEALKERVAKQPNITQLAVDLYRESDKNLDQQILQLEGGEEDDRGLDNYENVLPQVAHGRMIDEFINNVKDINVIANENPIIKAQLYELKNGGVYLKYPEYGEVVARNILSREYARRKGNIILNPVFNKSKYLDDLSDEIFKDSPALKQISDTRLKGNWENKIDTHGLIDEFGTGARRTFEQMGESFKDFIGAGKLKTERIEEGLKRGFGAVSSGVGGWREKLGQAANFTGMLTAMAATGAPLRGAGISPGTVHGVVTGSTFLDEELNIATQKYPGESWKANLEALAMTGLYIAGLKNALPTDKVRTILSKARPAITTELKNLSADVVESELKNRISKIVLDAGKGVLKGTGEMVALTTINQGLDRALGLPGEAWEKYHPNDELLEVAEGMMIGLAAPNLWSSIKNRNAIGNSLYNISISPNRYKEILSSEAEKSPSNNSDIQKKLENIQFLANQKSILDANNVPVPQQKRFLLEALDRKFKLENVPETPESKVLREHEKSVKGNERVMNDILSGKEVEPLRNEEELHEFIGPEEISKPIELSPELPEGYKMPEKVGVETEVNIPEKTEKLTEQESKAIEGLAKKDLKGTALEFQWNAIKDPETPIDQKKQALKEISDQLTAPGTEAETGQILGKEADLVYDLEYKRPTESTGLKEVTGKEGEIPPGTPGEPTEEKPTYTPSEVGITHARMDDIAREYGLETYQKDPETVEQWDAEAEKRLKEDPETLPKLFDKLRKGDFPDKIDNRVMIKYIADLTAKIDKNTTPQLLDQLKRTKDLFNIAGREQGKAFKARQGTMPPADTLADFLIQRGNDKGRPLTETQISEESKKYNELKEAKEKLEQQLEEERGQYARMVAEYGINKAKVAAKKAAKKTHEERISERKGAIEAAKEALKKLREEPQATILPGARELAAIAPHVKKYVESLVAEGIDKLDVIVSSVHAEFKDILDGITPKQISDIIGGEYDAKRQTKPQKASALRLLTKEAELLTELDKVRKGVEKEKSETKKEKKTDRISELENKIKELREKNKEELLDEGVEERSFQPEDKKQFDRDSAADSKYRQKLLKRADKLKKDIQEKRYEPEQKQEVRFVKSKKTIELEDMVIGLEKRLALDKLKDKLEKRSKSEKIYDFATREILGTKRIMQTILDWSIWARQTARLAFNPRKWDIFGKEVVKSWNATWSQKKFDRYMREIHKDPEFEEMNKFGIRFNEFETHEVDKENEFYYKNWLFKIPYLRQIPLSSQRAADSALNVARYELYKKYKKNLVDAGVTTESEPKVYEWMAKEVMNQTGRGNLLKMFENNQNAQKVLGNTFYGARLMASNFNQLNPVYYARMPKEVRQLIWKDIASYVVTTLSTGAALMAAGAKISFNPDDSDFLQARFGGKVYDVTGGKAMYIRTALRVLNSAMATGGMVSGTVDKSGATKKQRFAAESMLRFFRNKLAPNTGYFLNIINPQKEFGGREVGLKELIEFYPMYSDDAVKAFQDEGLTSLATTLLPNLIGVGYNQYFSDPAQQPVEDLLERNLRSDEMDLSKYKNYKEGGRIINEEEKKEFVKKRDSIIESKIKKLHEGETPVLEDEKVVRKKFKELTREQIISETSRIKSEATRQVREEMFGKEKKTRKQRIAERQLQKERKKVNL